MESWQLAFRNGFCPLFTPMALEALAAALESDDPALLQSASTFPPPLEAFRSMPVRCACPITFAASWTNGGLTTVGEAQEAFVRVCFEADQRLGEPAGCRYLLNWIDDTPREQMRLALLAEVRAELARRLEPVAA